MICRVCTLIEDGKGTPLLNQFPGAGQVSYQDGTVYVVYMPYANRRAPHSLILWKHSPGLYAIFGSKSLCKAFSTRSIIAYANQTTHGWRCFLASGIDTAINPITGLPIGAVIDRYRRFFMQPPSLVNAGNPWTDPGNTTFTITRLDPILNTTCGPINMVACATAVSDPNDQPGELTAMASEVLAEGDLVTANGEDVIVYG